MTTVGYGDKVPNSRVGKALGITWIFTSIILLSLYTANASAIIMSKQANVDINTAQDLRRARVGDRQPIEWRGVSHQRTHRLPSLLRYRTRYKCHAAGRTRLCGLQCPSAAIPE